MTFEIIKDKFYKNGEEIKIISGAVHYFRNLPDTWADIFQKMVAIGCNCVETYCAWNMHEQEKGKFSFDGILDIVTFIQLAQEAGLMVILRPGPYICAEWEFGGLPWWLQTQEGMEIRCYNPAYMQCFENYLSHLFDKVRPLLITNGGPIIMMQCENEYGNYGDDKAYLKKIYDVYRAHGIDVPLFTSDGDTKNVLLDGTIDGCFATLNMGSNVKERFKVHSELFPDSPKMCTELWDGWFDAWGDEKHHTTDAETYASVVDEALHFGSANMYMFIGGTNFGFTNGALHQSKYLPHVTSYDYDALLSECGDITPKYLAVRKVIEKIVGRALPALPKNREKKAYGKVAVNESVGILSSLEQLSAPIFSNVPNAMEDYGQGYGYIAYCTTLNRDYQTATLAFDGIGDRVHVYINHTCAGILYTNDEKLEMTITANSGDCLTILCENMGRANYGTKMMRKKGIIGRCLLDKKKHFNWNVYTLPMNNLDKLDFSKVSAEPSRFYRGYFSTEHCADTFIKLDNFTKGFVTVNGFNLGRYWDVGPQKTLYVPRSILKEGVNEVIVFESDGIKGDAEVEFIDHPIL